MSALIDYSRFEDYHQPKKRKAGPFLLLILAITLLLITARGYFGNREKTPEALNPVIGSVVENEVAASSNTEDSKTLELLVQNELANAQGDYAVAVKNLNTGENYFFNEHKIFESASLYKLFVMATVFQKIQDGNLSQNDILSQKIAILNQKFQISSESAELTEGDITLPINSALTRMITISDNYSALLLAEKVRLSQVSSFLKQNGLTESRVGTSGENPATSAYDIALFFEKLYSGELASKSNTQAMLVLLKNQKLNSKLPRLLPEDTEISHKTGELGRLSHDAGVVSTPKGDYIIVVLTQTSNPLVANEKIANISKSVYDYFNQ